MHRLFFKPISYKYGVRKINDGQNLTNIWVLNCRDQNFTLQTIVQNNALHFSMSWELHQVIMAGILDTEVAYAQIKCKCVH